MFLNYLKSAWRRISLHKIYSTINIAGLSLGLCACIVIYLFTSYELSFDHFHRDSQRIYRVMADVSENSGDKSHFARIPFPVPLLAKKEISGLDALTGIIPIHAKITIADGTNSSKHFDSHMAGTGSPTVVIAQSAWFSIFSYRMLAGNVDADPFTAVLTESKGHQYFGSVSPDKMIGRTVIYDDSLRVKVSGIVRDWDQHSDFGFTDFISFSTLQASFLKTSINEDSWGPGDMPVFTFVKLAKGVTTDGINKQLSLLVKSHAPLSTKLSLWLEPLSDIHFNADVVENGIRTAHMPTLYGLMGIALFVLLLGVINFINLSTALAIPRAKEIGVRKVLGGSRKSILMQFLTETGILTVISVLLAVILVNPVLNLFHSFIPAGISFHPSSPHMLIFLGVLTVITLLLAGLYPAKVLSGYLPAISLKGGAAQKGSEKWNMRKGLIVFQFAVSLIFIICSMVIGRQLNYTRSKDLGFTADAIISVETPFGDSLAKVRITAEKIRRISGVSGVALEWASPGDARGMSIKFKRTDQKETRVAQVDGDEELIPLYQIKLLAGRNLMHSDSANEFVINESLARQMGCKKPEEAIGKAIYWFEKPYPVVGVVTDFNSSSLHQPIVPLCILNRVEREGTLAIKVASRGKQANSLKATFAEIENAWKSIYPAGTFDYQFYDEALAMKYQQDQKTATLMNTAVLTTIFISCMGLFGLGMFTAERKTKEIGIRKVLGANISGIVTLLCKDFVILIFIALLIASPFAWFFMNKWLDSFAYRIEITWWEFFVAGSSTLIIALITVSFQAVKAAMANPVKSLRSE